MSPVAGELAAFATFAFGFFIRPVGGIVISHIGDRYGRKPALLLSVSLMGFATIAMGLLPTYSQVGILAPILLLVLRLIQGFGAGAELAGAIVVIAEYAPANRRAYLTSFPNAATVVGIMLATLGFLAFSQLPEPALLSWGWRVPFLVSALFFVVALYIRNQLEKTPAYVKASEHAARERQKTAVPITQLLRERPADVFWGFLSVTGHNANSYILSAFSLIYLTNTVGMDRTSALMAVVIAAFCGIVCTPEGGRCVRKWPRLCRWRGVRAGDAWPLFAMLDTGSFWVATIGLSLCYGIGFGATGGAQGAFLSNLFPTEYRFSGLALVREMNGVLVAGPTPFIASALVAADGGSATLVVLYFMACAFLTVLAVAVQTRRSTPLSNSPS